MRGVSFPMVSGVNCPACGRPLNGKLYLCESCFAKAPGKERASLWAMHQRRQDCTSKVEKIVRILQAKQLSETPVEKLNAADD